MSAHTATTTAPQQPNKWLITLAAMFGTIITVLSTTTLNVAIADVKAGLGASINEIGWVVTAFMITNVIVMPMAGWFSDLFGLRKFFIGCLVLFTISSFFCAIAWDVNSLIFFRLIQGIGAGAMPSVAMMIIWETFPPEERMTGMAIYGLGVTLGPVLGPLLGGYIGQAFDWRMIFFVNIPFGILAIFLGFMFIQDSKHSVKVENIDWWGIATLISLVVSLQIILQDGQKEGWLSSSYILTLVVVGIVSLVIFLIVEFKAKRPIVDLRIYQKRDYMLGTIIMILVGIALFGPMFLIPLYAGSMLGYTAWMIGLIMLPMGVAMAFGMMFMGRFGNKYNPILLVSIGILLVGISFVGITNLSKDTTFEYLAWIQMPRGIGLALLFIPLTNICMKALEPHEVGNGSSLFNFTRTLGGSLGIAWLSTMLSTQHEFHYNNLAAYMTGFDQQVVTTLKMLEMGFMSKGADIQTAHQQALTMLAGMAHTKAFLMAYNDVFVVASLFTFVCFIPLFFIKGKKG